MEKYGQVVRWSRWAAIVTALLGATAVGAQSDTPPLQPFTGNHEVRVDSAADDA